MSDYEEQLLTIIREHENPELMLHIAIDIITSFLTQPESYQQSSVDSLQELV